MRIRNKKTGQIIEVQPEQLSDYGIYQAGGSTFYDELKSQNKPIIDRGNFSNIPYTPTQQRTLQNVKQKEKKIALNQLRQEQSARSAKEKGTKFQLPNGQNKSYNEMTIKERSYVDGQVLRNKGRWNENSAEQPFLNNFNPVTFIYDMAAGLGEAPLMSDVTNSVIPYVTGIGTPLAVGALAGLGSKTTGQFVNNLANPLAGTGDLINNLGNKYFPNAYKINPKALKEAQEQMLVRARPVGQDPYINMAEQLKAKQAAGEQLTWYQKNLLNPQTNPQMAAREKYFGQWFADNPSDLDFYINPGTRNFADDAQIEILKARMPKSEAVKYNVKNFEDAKKLSNLHDTEFILPKDMVQQLERHSVDDLPKLIKEYNEINKPHWLKGYKEVEVPKTNNFLNKIKWKADLPEGTVVNGISLNSLKKTPKNSFQSEIELVPTNNEFRGENSYYIKKGNELIGDFDLEKEGDKYITWNVGLNPEYRGKGLGKQAYIQANELLKNQNKGLLHSSGNFIGSQAKNVWKSLTKEGKAIQLGEDEWRFLKFGGTIKVLDTKIEKNKKYYLINE